LRAAFGSVRAVLLKSSIAATSAFSSSAERSFWRPFIFDLHEGRGPLGGLQAALAYARTPWIFVLACDYPFVSGDLIRLLAGRVHDELGAVVPEQEDGRMQPLCGFYASAFTRLLALFNLSCRTDVASCRGVGDASCVLKVSLLEGEPVIEPQLETL
jgi:molybdopterin-guanine dinucleotide biosynthesis protein A